MPPSLLAYAGHPTSLQTLQGTGGDGFGGQAVLFGDQLVKVSRCERSASLLLLKGWEERAWAGRAGPLFRSGGTERQALIMIVAHAR